MIVKIYELYTIPRKFLELTFLFLSVSCHMSVAMIGVLTWSFEKYAPRLL